MRRSQVPGSRYRCCGTGRSFRSQCLRTGWGRTDIRPGAVFCPLRITGIACGPGGQLDFVRPLRVGVQAHRTTTIGAVEEKQGRSGSLLFVTVNHDYTQADQLCVREQQNIVYREPTAPKKNSDFVVPEPAWCERFHPTPVTLFRYSAVTFNGHRIHYDHPYATGVEGYIGLVVHGPLQATLMLQMFQQHYSGRIPKAYTYRGLRPLTADEPFNIAGADIAADRARLWTFTERGPAHHAEVQFEES